MNIKHLPSLALVGFMALLFQVGCERGTQSSGFAYGDSTVSTDDTKKDTTDPAPTNIFIGTWKLTPTGGGPAWYAFFNADNSWKICDNADGSSQRVYGSYSFSGSTLSGNMTNPGVGTGTIAATISEGVMTLDFTEHWQTPYKTIQYTGSKN